MNDLDIDFDFSAIGLTPQFEREVTSERIRDKVAASKRKGLWVGGMTPLGYDTKDRKITVNKTEAECVRTSSAPI